MLRNLILALLPLALFAAACAGGGDSADREAGPTPAPDVAADQSASRESGAPPPAADATSDGPNEATDVLLAALNPLQFLGGFDTADASQNVDPSLAAALLTADDLPAGFQPMGEFTFAMPSDIGEMQMGASMFASGDLANEDFDAMVMSATISLPPEALAEIGDLSSLGLTEADLAEVQDASGEFGMEFADLRVLDASGLGEGGFGMHLELDFGALFAAFGPIEGEEPPPAGIAMDMYAFLHGEQMLMTMLMWPTDRTPGVDAFDLALIMEEKAAS